MSATRKYYRKKDGSLAVVIELEPASLNLAGSSSRCRTAPFSTPTRTRCGGPARRSGPASTPAIQTRPSPPSRPLPDAALALLREGWDEGLEP